MLKPNNDAVVRIDLSVWAIWAVMAMAVVVRLYHADTISLWTDELFTERYTNMGLRFIWTDGLHVESNPPLYYTVVLLWRIVAGSSELALRLPSIGCSLAGIYAVYRLTLLLFKNEVEAVIAAAIIALAPTSLFFAQEARAYSMQSAALAFALLGVAMLILRPQERNGWIIYGIAALIAIYSHVTSAIAVASIGLFVLFWFIRERRVEGWRALIFWIGLQGAISVLCLPLVQTLQAGNRVAWIAPVSIYGLQAILSDLLLGPAALPEKMWIGRALLIGLVVAIIFLARGSNRLALLVLVSIPSLDLGLMTLASLVKPMLMTRTVFWVLSPLAVLAAHALVDGCTRVFGRRKRVVLALVLSLWAMLVIVDRGHAGLVKENWREFLASLPELRDASTLIVVGPHTPVTAIKRYGEIASEPKMLEVGDIDALGLQIDPVATVTWLGIANALAAGRPIWLILRGGDVGLAEQAPNDLKRADQILTNQSDYRIQAVHWKPKPK